MYNGLFQANFIHDFYGLIRELQATEEKPKPARKYQTYALIGIVLIIGAYLIIKFFPFVLYKIELFWYHIHATTNK